MADVLLTFHCVPADADAIAACLSAHSRRPVRVRRETMRGGDFRDASAAELVAGEVQRIAIEIVVRQKLARVMADAVAGLRRLGPVHWRMMPVVARGRML